MQILAAYKSRLLATPAVASKATGGVWIGHVDQNQTRPNILLELREAGQDYTHAGPVGLIDAHVVVTCRADVDSAAAALGDATDAALMNWRGTAAGCVVQLSEIFNVMLEYDPTVKVFKRVSEYTAFYSRS